MAGRPGCITQTQHSSCTDPWRRDAASGHALDMRAVRPSADVAVVLRVCGDIRTVPGLRAAPPSEHIEVTDDRRIVGVV